MTDQEYETTYAEGRQAWRCDAGFHGPTLYLHHYEKTANPYTDERAPVWEAGYRQDVRRVQA